MKLANRASITFSLWGSQITIEAEHPQSGELIVTPISVVPKMPPHIPEDKKLAQRQWQTYRDNAFYTLSCEINLPMSSWMVLE